MEKIKVLFIPNGMPSHLIPLIALAKSLDPHRFASVFLLPDILHAYVRAAGFEAIHIHRSTMDAWENKPDQVLEADLNHELRAEVDAIAGYGPGVLVDDLNFHTAFSSVITGTPRISVVRRGVIPNEEITAGTSHSSGLPQYLARTGKTRFDGYRYWQPKAYCDLFRGDFNIIPSIPRVEALPARLENKRAYGYAGPLLMQDHEMTGPLTYGGDIAGRVAAFFAENAGRKVVYFTVGLASPSTIVRHAETCIHALLDRGLAVITNVRPAGSPDAGRQSRFFASEYLPMHQVCAGADLMVHQCGSGTYNYQLTYELPAIVLGSGCYDRDSIAVQLDALGAACFIPADLDEAAYHRRFIATAGQLLDPASAARTGQQAALATLKAEIGAVQRAFDFGRVVARTASRAAVAEPNE